MSGVSEAKKKEQQNREPVARRRRGAVSNAPASPHAGQRPSKVVGQLRRGLRRRPVVHGRFQLLRNTPLEKGVEAKVCPASGRSLLCVPVVRSGRNGVWRLARRSWGGWRGRRGRDRARTKGRSPRGSQGKENRRRGEQERSGAQRLLGESMSKRGQGSKQRRRRHSDGAVPQ